MGIIHRRGFAVAYWVVAFLAMVGGLIIGGKAGHGGAPSFGDDAGASGASSLLFAIGGGLLGALAALAVFAGLWLGLWALERRNNPMSDDEEYASLDDLEDLGSDDDDEGEDHDGFDDEHNDADMRDVDVAGAHRATS